MSSSKKMTYIAVAVVVAAIAIGAVVAYNPFAAPSSIAPSSGSPTGTATSQGQSQTSQQSSTSSQGGTGTLSFYLTDAPPSNRTLKYLLVNVSSVDLRYEGNLSATTTTTTSHSTTITTSTGTSTTSTTSTSSTTTAGSALPENLFVFRVPTSTGMNVNLTKLQGQSLLLGAAKMPAGNITSVTLNITGAEAFYTNGSSEQLKVVADGKLMIPIHFQVKASGSTNLTFDITPNLIHISQGGVLTPVIHSTAVEKGPDNSTTTETTEVTDTSTS